MSMTATPVYDELVKKFDFDPEAMEFYDREKAQIAHEQWAMDLFERVKNADLPKKGKKRPAKR